MRIEQTKIYQFSELGERAKESARDWYREGLYNDPPWLEEHQESRKAALAWIENVGHSELTGVRLFKYIQNNMAPGTLDGNCPFTGYCGDEYALDVVREFMARPTYGTNVLDLKTWINSAMDLMWDREFEWLHEDEQIDESIEANEYEFTENGAVYS